MNKFTIVAVIAVIIGLIPFPAIFVFYALCNKETGELPQVAFAWFLLWSIFILILSHFASKKKETAFNISVGIAKIPVTLVISVVVAAVIIHILAFIADCIN